MAVLNFESQTFKGPPVLLDVLLPSVGCQKAVVCKVLQNWAPKKFFYLVFATDSTLFLSVSSKYSCFVLLFSQVVLRRQPPRLSWRLLGWNQIWWQNFIWLLLFLFLASNYHFSFLLERAAKCCPLGFTSSFTSLSFNQIRSFLNLELSSGPHLSTKLYLGNKSSVILVTMQKKLSPGPFLDLGLKALNLSVFEHQNDQGLCASLWLCALSLKMRPRALSLEMTLVGSLRLKLARIYEFVAVSEFGH